MDTGFWVPIVVSLGFFVMIGWVVWVESRRRRALAMAAAEVHGRLLDKFESSRELVDFLQTDEGKLFMLTASGSHTMPIERVIRSIKYGAVLFVIGLGLLVMGLTGKFDDDGTLSVLGYLFEIVGVGFLVSAGVSHYFSRRWGLYRNFEWPAGKHAASGSETAA